VSAPSLGSLAVLAALALVPLLLIVGTSFVKASVVLSLLRNALGTGGVPSGGVVVALAGLLTVYVMAPTLREAATAAAVPLAALDVDAPLAGPQRATLLEALGLAKEPVRAFLERNAGAREKGLFAELLRRSDPSATEGDFLVVLPAFLITELAEALQLGFLLLLPFLVVDLVVGSVLMALGMASVSPSAVAIPLKLLLFLSVDGFYALSRALITGYA
jgi:type III secretion protein R